MRRFRKLAHCSSRELGSFKKIKIRISVMSFISELAMKYNNESQLVICQIELERLKEEYETLLSNVYKRTGNFPGGGKIEVYRAGDIIEYYNE